jgi:hypothetical protein
MAKWYRKNGSEISPCIIAKVKYKLGVTSKIPKNTKNCSDAYWNEVMSIVARTYKKKYKALLK